MAAEADEPKASAEAIFSEALGQPPAERPAYLTRACGDNRPLRRRVEALLRAHDAPEGFLPEQPRTPPGGNTTVASLLAGQLTEQPGDTIGRYKLREKIGEGGCGVVYMTEQEVPVRRKVALKIIKLGMDTKQVVARFEAERQALALMDHANIAKVLDAGATETGRPYFVMELVGGIKITDYCDQNQLMTHERLGLFIQVCRAIQHAHQKGVIHRDIKPSNVLVAIQDGVPIPKVIDFGIAKATQGRLTDQTVFTAFEQFLGTPAYMSPEQAQLGSLDVDTRSDIYSLGVLLYELLTGKTPFDSRELLASGLDAMRRTIQEKDPPTPSTRLKKEIVGDDVRRLDSKSGEEIRASSRRLLQKKELIRLLCGDLDWIVMKCLEKDRARRYETANGLATDIERHLKNEPVAARPPSRLYEFQKTLRRHKFGFVATAGVIAALIGGIVATSLQGVRARRAEREQARLLQEAQAARRDATEKLWSSYLAEVRALKVSGQPGRQFDSLDTVRKAAAIHPSLALRNEAIACMTLPDIRWLKAKDLTKTRETVCFDSSFERYAVCEQSGTVSVRRATDDVVIARLPEVGVAATAVGLFSPDSRFLLVPYADGRRRVWDWSKPAIALESARETGEAFAPDSRTFAILDVTNIVLYNLTSGERLNTISLNGLGSPRRPKWLNFDPTGRRIALFETEMRTNVVIMDTRTGDVLKALQHPAHVWSVAWHPAGRYLATGCNDGTIQIWDSTTGEKVRKWTTETCISIGFNHEGNRLVSSGWGGYTRLWDYSTGQELIGLYGVTGNVICFSSNDLKFATAGWEGRSADFFEVTANQESRALYETSHPYGNGGNGPIMDRTGKLLAFRTREGIGLLDFQTGRQIGFSKREEDENLIGFDEDDQNLVLTARRGLLRRPLTKSDVPGSSNIGNPILVSAECANPDSGRFGFMSGNCKICATIADGRCQLFRTDRFEKQAETGVQLGMRYSDLSPDGSLFASAAWQRPGLNVWSTGTGALMKELPTNEESSTVVFSPEGRFLVIASRFEYCFWEVASWTPTRRIPQPAGNDFAPMMAFSRDGRLFAGTHTRNKIRLHNAATGEVLADLEAPKSTTITGLALNFDGTLLASSESADVFRLWDLRLIRQRLAELGLDWNQPPYPPAQEKPAASN
jgi:serine/threonine protein kinase/WD40 repeat protein